MTRYIQFNSRLLVLFTIITFCNFIFSGCFSLKEATIIDNPELKVYQIETHAKEVIDFRDSKLGYAEISNNTIICKNEIGDDVIYQLSDVNKIYTEKFDYLYTSIVVVSVVFGVIIFVSIALAPALILDKGMGGV